MMLVWLISIKLRNAGIVDVAWSLGFTPVVWFYYLMAAGNPARKLIIALMVSIWSLRLGMHLYKRVMGHHPVEDARYAQFRKKWGPTFNLKMYWFFQIQAVLLWALSYPFLVAAHNPDPSIHWLEWLGLALWIMGVRGETIADQQLTDFAAQPQNKGKVCQQGFWRYSRHPNYFFEWVIWVSYFVFVSAQPQGLYAILCPIVMLHFLLNVTGVKLAEEGSLKRRGDAYREYQRTTSAFVPWFNKK